MRLMIDARLGCCRENLMGTLPEWLIATGTVFMLFRVSFVSAPAIMLDPACRAA